ncbi:hypothetical protein DP939_18240 [Spongiactinospora rosea]|uniref:Uncharacterized protein n=1 Tax=Spongiactinospora rosea TaxID=2248750 RepID=A0A366LWX6_9ACTN|nr:hypothetical protein [Spongiactinospora rosea]RBQ18455.1 hypothetical protein DP939_18240 [Spongiactinospora rosea]
MAVRLSRIVVASAFVMMPLASCASDPMATCNQAYSILNEAETAPSEWTTRGAAPTSVTEEKALAEVIRRVAALETGDPYLKEGFGNLRRASERHREELDKLLKDSPQGSNVRLAGATTVYVLMVLVRRCETKV